MADGKVNPRRDFMNQKQLRESSHKQNVTNLSGDGAMDDRVDDEGPVQEEHNALQIHRQLGGPFMHPMHDASLDEQFTDR
jgi:hypothetical protein